MKMMKSMKIHIQDRKKATDFSSFFLDLDSLFFRKSFADNRGLLLLENGEF